VSVLSGERPASDRSILRFIAFGVAVIIGVGALTTRLAFLQIAHSGQYAELSDRNRSVLQAIPSSRGLIFDRAGRPLVTNVPSFAVKIRPADLPLSQRDAVLTRLGGLLQMDPSDINTEIDSNPGSRFDLLVKADNPGVWAFHCHILNHVEGPSGMFGMVTALIVQ